MENTFPKLLLGVTITADEEEIPQINEELNIHEHSTVITHINNGKACVHDDIPAEVWKLINFQIILGIFITAYMINII